MSNTNQDTLSPELLAQIMKAVTAVTPAPVAPAPDYFAQAEVNRAEANRLQKLAVASLPVLKDQSVFDAIRLSVITGVQCEETSSLNKADGFRLSDDQKELKKIANQAHVTEINSDDFKANLTSQIEEAELKSFKQSLPSKKTGEVTRSVSW